MIAVAPMKLKELRTKLCAYEAAERAVSAITEAHIAMRTAGISGGCDAAMQAVRAAMNSAREDFNSAYKAASSELDEAGADSLHKAVFGQ